MSVRTVAAAILLAAFVDCVEAHAEAWNLEWDRRLPALRLTNVSIDSENFIDAWRDFTAGHLVRCIIVLPDGFEQGRRFVFLRQTCTVSDVLNALCETYACQWESDAATGVIWIAPEGAATALHLDDTVEVPEDLRSVPMHSGVLEELLGQNRQFLLSARRTWMNMYDYAVSIPAGTTSVCALLNQCLVWNPAMTFAVRYETGRTDILAVYVPVDNQRMGCEGARFFWEVETSLVTEPDIDEVLNSMGSVDPRKRWAAQAYWRLALHVRIVCQHFGSRLESETKMRAVFAFLMSWIPRGIPGQEPDDLKNAVQAALDSPDFNALASDVRVRIIALRLAATSEGFYRQGRGDMLLLGPDRQALLHDPHFMDSHPDVVAAKERETSLREVLLNKLPPDVDEVLANAEFDLRQFLNLYPWVADYLRSR